MLENNENNFSGGFAPSQNSGEIIYTNDSLNPPLLSQDNERLIDPGIVQVLLQEFKAESTNVKDILQSEAIDVREKDNFDVIKFTIKVKAVYDYNWEVYRKPSEIKNNFADIRNELSRNFMQPSGKEAEIFKTVAVMSENSIKTQIVEIEDYYKSFFQNIKIYNTLAFKEFFNISKGSFNQYNKGSKPFEGYCKKKANPRLLRNLLSFVCCLLERIFFTQYNIRWIVVKDDCICYSDKSNLDIKNNVYAFDESLTLDKEGEIIIIKNRGRGIRDLILKFQNPFETQIWYREIKKRLDAKKNALH
jgi:hypothetical protein